MNEVIAEAMKLRAIRDLIVNGLNGWNWCPENGDPRVTPETIARHRAEGAGFAAADAG